MKYIFILILLIQIQTISSQQILEDHPLSKTIEETSGLEIIDNMLITLKKKLIERRLIKIGFILKGLNWVRIKGGHSSLKLNKDSD